VTGVQTCALPISLCKNCKKFIPYDKRNNDFCSHSCSASFNNAGVKRNTKDGRWVKKQCVWCGSETVNKKYCSYECCRYDKKNNRRNKIVRDGSLVNYAKDKWYLIETRGNKCEICNNTQWMGQEIPLDVDHIDGNSDNDSLSNVRLICPNCHRQTNNYGSKNKGSGRFSKRKQYRKRRYDNKLSY
jgi:hypothetical protein